MEKPVQIVVSAVEHAVTGTGLALHEGGMARSDLAGGVAAPPSANLTQQHIHPDHLAVIALLHGLEPPPSAKCRVLELGCGGGGNLIPMALDLPDSEFAGVDASAETIEAGRTLAQELGLNNVVLQMRNHFQANGTYDFVIADGGDEETRETLFALCERHLAPNGVAYIKYDTYPGWHMKDSIRDTVRESGASDLVRFLTENDARGNDARTMFLRLALRHQNREPVSGDRSPVYFYELISRASRHGLQYLGDAEQQLMDLDNLSPDLAAQLRSFTSNRVDLEQYLDFVVNRSLRQTLLCRDAIDLDRSIRPERMRRLFAATSAKPVSSSPDFRAGAPEVFETETKKAFTSSHPAAKAVIAALADVWPRSLSFDELRANVGDRIGSAEERVIAELLYALFWSGIAELHLVPPRCASVVSAKPRASALARRQAAAGVLVTSQRRRALRLDDPITRYLLIQLDGTHDHASLVRLLDSEVSAGRLDVEIDGDPARIPMVLQALLDHHLRRMAEYAMLVD